MMKRGIAVGLLALAASLGLTMAYFLRPYRSSASADLKSNSRKSGATVASCVGRTAPTMRGATS